MPIEIDDRPGRFDQIDHRSKIRVVAGATCGMQWLNFRPRRGVAAVLKGGTCEVNVLKKLAEYDVVKIVKLVKDGRSFSGSNNVSRSPRIGDAGTIVHVNEMNVSFIVEMTDSNGCTIWLADFVAEELELV